jgi:hypothetical protein
MSRSQAGSRGANPGGAADDRRRKAGEGACASGRRKAAGMGLGQMCGGTDVRRSKPNVRKISGPDPDRVLLMCVGS